MLSALIAIALQGATATAEPPMVTRPTWVRRPAAQQYAQNYPLAAQKVDLAGEAAINCVVTAAGTLSDCTVMSQEPPGGAFGDAAMKVSPYFKMLPTDAEGQPTVGRRIRVPIRFLLPRAAKVSTITLKVPQYAGAEVDVDCRFRGTQLDNCFVIRSPASNPAVREAALELVKKLPMSRPPVPSGRMVLPLRFVAD